ncbi:hypothetical protein GGR53DRAFT_471288 [Hypoxylon sp. FL1150]|nr:hypothetical protein GGR53DRAFT_471288 [Hypoxylon sp. FL1150]
MSIPSYFVKIMFISICIVLLASKVVGSPAGHPVGHPVGHGHSVGHNCTTQHNTTASSNAADVTSSNNELAVGFVGQEKNVTIFSTANSTDDDPQNGGNGWPCERCWTSAAIPIAAELRKALITFFVCLIMIRIFI